MAPPPRKKLRTTTLPAEPSFPCFSCLTDRVSTAFPDYNPTPDCEHLINTCKSCLKKWVKCSIEAGTFAPAFVSEEGVEFIGIKCPQSGCEGVMRNVNVMHAATRKVYQRFEELERKHIGDTTPGWRWCLAPGCKGGQIHRSKVPDKDEVKSKPQSRRDKATEKFKSVFVAAAKEEEADIFTCNLCHARACVPCDRPWHHGETCAEFQARTQDRMEEEDEALKTIYQVTKPCPGCKKRIQKNGGCPNMFCSQCHINFCWRCELVIGECGCGRR